MSERQSNPIVAPLVTRPGESLENIGSKEVTTLLPSILQTQVNKQFLDSTLEQVMSSGSLQSVKNYVGSQAGNRQWSKDITDDYILDGRSNDPYQFSPGTVNRNDDKSIIGALPYDDLIKTLKYNESDTNNHNRLFNEPGYTMDMPINYDMFINHHKYYWVLDVLPPSPLQYTSLFDINTIIGQIQYTTPTQKNGRALTFENGMRVKFAPHTVDRFTQTVVGNTTFTATVNGGHEFIFKNNQPVLTGDYTFVQATGVLTMNTAPAVTDEIEIHTNYAGDTGNTYFNDGVYIVDGVGSKTGIKLTKQFEPGQYQGQQGKRVWLNITTYSSQEPSEFDSDKFAFDFKPYDLREHRMTTRDYLVEERFSTDQSAWARSNLWVHEQTIANSLIYDGYANVRDELYAIDKYRAVRPIIEYKANIEKYNFGSKHITNVDHALESGDDPATTIVGKTSYSVSISGITTDWQPINGADRGQRVKIDSGASPNIVTTYWECVQNHGDPKNPLDASNRDTWQQITPVELEDGDTIIFFRTSNTVYKNKIFQVSGVGTSIALTVKYNSDGTSGATALATGDKIVILNGFNTYEFGNPGGNGQGNFEAPLSGAELYWNNSAWSYGQQKKHRSAGILQQLYDLELVKLQDTTNYPVSTFNGGHIFNFSYKESNVYDEALGFNPEYVDYGNNPGLNFDVDLFHKRFNYTFQSTDFQKNVSREIEGYYYYKFVDTGRYHNGWSFIRSGQPTERIIQKTVIDATVPLKFNVGHNNFDTDRHYHFSKEQNLLIVHSQPTTLVANSRPNRLGGKLPNLFLNTGTTYTIRTQFPQSEIEFVDIDGSTLNSAITRSGANNDLFTLTIATTPTITSFKYRLAADPTNFGVVFLKTNTKDDNIRITKNGVAITNYTLSGNIVTVNSGLKKDDIYELECFTDARYSDDVEGYQKVADTHLANPQNLTFGKVSFGDLLGHMRSQMRSNPLFEDDWFGTNNYRNIVHDHALGGTIRQQAYSTELISQLFTENDTDIVSSLQYSSNAYKEFKKLFKHKIKQLHESTDITEPVYKLVDKTLEALNLGKNKNSTFARSQVAMYRDYESENYNWVLNQTPVFNLPFTVNKYDDTQNHIQVWIQIPDAAGAHTWRALIKDVEYTLSDYQVTITLSGITFPSTGRNNIHVRWYRKDSVSFVPPSASKLGLTQPYIPALYDDFIRLSGTGTTTPVIIGHDGSYHTRNGTELYDRQVAGFDPVDAGLWDLELRMYNNLSAGLEFTLDTKRFWPNANRPTPYSWTEFHSAMKSEFNKWKVANKVVNLTSDTYYNGADAFTWNYSSVGPGIGGYKGLYRYFFNTATPETAPWEMLGYNKKPTWWDANYSWTDAPKRTALITALKYGQTSNPSAATATYSASYSYSQYDWAVNTLVKNTGELNDPIAAGVVTSPALAERQKDFVYSDWGPIENQWRTASEFRFAQMIAVTRVRPLIASNFYFKTGKRRGENKLGYEFAQVINTDSKKLTSWRDIEITDSKVIGSIIESIRIKNAGSGYTSAPTVTIYDNFGINGKAQVQISNGSIVSAKVLDGGERYYNRPSIVLSSGNAILEAQLADNARRYFDGLSNCIIEYAKFNGGDADTILNRFKNMTFNPIVKAGGFVNSNQNFVLESSQDKGRVFVPEENFTTMLFNNKPETEFFFGGIIVTKSANGYTINGYDNSLGYFKYNAPATNGPSAKVAFSGTLQIDVRRYTDFETVISQLDYNTELKTIQEVYDFISGYGNYLNGLGFTQSWTGASSNFGNWATGSATQFPLYLIPDSTTVVVKDNKDGYFDNLNTRYDGVYNILDNLGKQISATDIAINRTSMSTYEDTIFEVKDSSKTNLYGLRLYKSQIEHIFVFDNVTNFDDTISSAEIGQIHKRIQWRGSRTKDWNGKLYSPGYIINGNTILPNFDTTAKEVDQYLGRTNTLSNKQISDVARFNSGYNKPNWASTLDLDDDSVYEFVKGTYKYKGTRYALDAFMRNTGLFDGEATADLHEMWAVRMADFGDTSKSETVEFQITPDLLVTDPQPIRFSSGDKFDTLSDIVIDIGSTSPLRVYSNAADSSKFKTREVTTYSDQNQTSEFADDFVKSGLPLLSETDYRTLNKEDFTLFPTETKDVYDFSGNWKLYDQWDSKTSYKQNNKVIYKGRVWDMVDPDGASGLTNARNPIEIHGTVTLPVIPTAGQTLLIDGNTISLTKSAVSETLNIITIDSTSDIKTSDVVTHGSTLILGQAATLATSISFSNVVITTTFNDITKTGNVINPIIQGSASAALTIDGTTINFNDPLITSNPITAQVAFENTFNSSSWVQNQGSIASIASQRIGRIEQLRVAYIAANTSTAWTQWIQTYFGNNAGLNIDHLKTLIALGGSTLTAAQFMLDQDCILINNLLGTNFIGQNVGDGTETISSAQLDTCRGRLNLGTYTDDIATYLKNAANATIVFDVNTQVASESTSGFKTYSLADIIIKINAAGIALVTAGQSANSQLTITKTTNDTSTSFSLSISSATMNATVGFNTATETISSTSSDVLTYPNLTQQQVIDQINQAGITGITASTLGNLIRLQSNNSNLYVGPGTANSVIGLNSGISPASTTTTTTSATLGITDILESINLATINGVVATNSQNKVHISSTNSTLVIGAGTANITIGLTAQTYSATEGPVSNVFNAIVGSDGNQVFVEMNNDPNLFSIWVADNSEFGNYNLGYEVYQTMDFGMFTNKVCTGIVSSDEAQIDVVRQTGNVQAHNLEVGDYVFINGSNSIPSIDGIHQVTRVDTNNIARFYIDEYIETEGDAGNIYPLRKMRFSTYTAMEADRQTKVNGVYKYNFASIRQDNALNPIYTFVDDDGSAVSQVYKWVGTWNDSTGNVGEWQIVRSGNVQARNDLINSVKIYDAVKQTTIAGLETWDPAKGIVFGFIDNEIDIKLTNDVANYNYNTLDGAIDNPDSWDRNYIGKRWWDLSQAVYLDYEQGSIDYMQNNWARLFDGASIDVYEWTRSPVLPESWSALVDRATVVDGNVASGEVYFTIINGEEVYNWTEEAYYNNRTKQTDTSYYFWVKNKTNFSGVRRYNVLQLSQLLTDPGSNGLRWASQAGGNQLLLSGIESLVTKNSVVQLDMKRDGLGLSMQDWLMLAEADPQSIIPEYLHIKVRDSLCGFNKHSIIKSFTTWASNTSYSADQVVIDGANYYISRVNSNLNNQPSTDSDTSHWNRIYDFEEDNSTEANDIIIRRDQPVPNLKLHKFNRYGHQVRPRQSLYRELEEARQNFVYTVNSLLREVNVIDEMNNWETAFSHEFVEGTVNYKVSDYVAFKDWHLVERDDNNNVTFRFNPNTVADVVYETKQAYLDAGDPAEGSYVLVKDTSSLLGIARSEMYHFTGGTDKLVFKEKATLELSEELWLNPKFGHGYDAQGFDVTPFDSSSEIVLSKLFDLIRTKIFIGKHQVKYNKLWFKMLFTALLQNTADDFAFKTTYTHLAIKHPLLLNKKTYNPYTIDPIEEFVNSVKPFHTKLLSSIDSNTHSEATTIEIEEQSRNSEITMKYEDHSTRTWAGDTILSGGTFSTVFGADVDYSLFTTSNAALEYDYNGNVFQQTALEGWGEELVPTDYTENISILVQTNTSGSTYDADSRAFRINMYQPMDLQQSTAIVDANKTFLTTGCTAFSTEIVLNQIFASMPLSGVVWIGTERIEYGAYEGATLRYCTRGTRGTSAQAHAVNAVVNYEPTIPTLDNFSHYGDNLRLAYNDSGISLSATGISPEHAFIRNAGTGSI